MRRRWHPNVCEVGRKARLCPKREREREGGQRERERERRRVTRREERKSRGGGGRMRQLCGGLLGENLLLL